MADKKISALTGATTPLAGTEVLPIVQSGTTVKVAVSDLTAGRAVSASSVTASTGDVTSTAGNVVVSTSGKGVTTTGAISLGLGTNGSTSQATVDTGGSFLVGTTNTSGIINNSVKIIGGIFSTVSGSTSIPNAAATTIVTLPNLGTGVYIVTASIPGAGGAGSFAATALITTQGTSSAVSTLHTTAFITFTLSSLDLQVTQTAGSTYTFAWTVIRLT
jgi:hypothetical protein